MGFFANALVNSFIFINESLVCYQYAVEELVKTALC